MPDISSLNTCGSLPNLKTNVARVIYFIHNFPEYTSVWPPFIKTAYARYVCTNDMYKPAWTGPTHKSESSSLILEDMWLGSTAEIRWVLHCTSTSIFTHHSQVDKAKD